jgi:hypothetical protein
MKEGEEGRDGRRGRNREIEGHEGREREQRWLGCIIKNIVTLHKAGACLGVDLTPTVQPI